MNRCRDRLPSCCPAMTSALSRRWGWAGKHNGELLHMAADDFDALLTADQNLEHQQNLGPLRIAVIVLVAPTNRIESLRPLIPTLLRTLQTLTPRQFVHVRV